MIGWRYANIYNGTHQNDYNSSNIQVWKLPRYAETQSNILLLILKTRPIKHCFLVPLCNSYTLHKLYFGIAIIIFVISLVRLEAVLHLFYFK